MIRTAEQHIRSRPGARDIAVEFHATMWAKHNPRVPFVVPVTIADAPTVTAFVNEGRWIVRCPFCPSASLACQTDPRFLCVECGNTGVGGKWVTVVWPDDRDQIEAVLDRRRKDTTRNWFPHESVADLTRDNVAHGDR